MISSYRREGTTEYACMTLECNWQEERSREAAGEIVKLSLMDGAVVRPEEPEISIAPAMFPIASSLPAMSVENLVNQMLQSRNWKVLRTITSLGGAGESPILLVG